MNDNDDGTTAPAGAIPPRPPLPASNQLPPSLPPGWSIATSVRPRERGRGSDARARVMMLLRHDPRSWLAIYIVVLAGIAFSPVPVDSGAGPLLRAITKAFPVLTYHRIEFGANIVLFVPLGLLLALILPRRRYLVVPIAFVATVSIESLQGIFLGARVASILDVVANTTGACIGLLIAEVVPALRRRGEPRS